MYFETILLFIPILISPRFSRSSRVWFKDALLAISKNAFSKSAFPILVFLDVHCSGAQQEAAAQSIRETFGSQLAIAAVGSLQQPLRHLSPASLVNKIVFIQVKGNEGKGW